MAGSKVFVVIGGFVGFWASQQLAFLPAASKPVQPVSPLVSASCMAAILAAGQSAAVHADAIDDAAVALGANTYLMLKSIKWDADFYTKKLPGVDNVQTIKALDKALQMGAQIDGEDLKKAVLAHSKAIQSIDTNGVCSLKDYQDILSAIGHMIVKVPVENTMETFNAFASITPPGVPAYLQKMVGEEQAKWSYGQFMAFKDVVKATMKGTV